MATHCFQSGIMRHAFKVEEQKAAIHFLAGLRLATHANPSLNFSLPDYLMWWFAAECKEHIESIMPEATQANMNVLFIVADSLIHTAGLANPTTGWFTHVDYSSAACKEHEPNPITSQQARRSWIFVVSHHFPPCERMSCACSITHCYFTFTLYHPRLPFPGGENLCHFFKWLKKQNNNISTREERDACEGSSTRAPKTQHGLDLFFWIITNGVSLSIWFQEILG